MSIPSRYKTLITGIRILGPNPCYMRHFLPKLLRTWGSCGRSNKIKMTDSEDSISRGSIEVCRVMVPDDANIAGNVHGGTTLKLIEEAGYIIATRHCNKVKPDEKTQYNAALARVERTDFLQPVFIGEVVQVHAELGYPSKHSLEVKVSVWAENLMTGARRLTNRAALWYVPVDVKQSRQGNVVIGDVPPVENLSDIEMEKGKDRYEYQKRSRIEKEEILKKMPCNCANHSTASNSKEVPVHSMSASQSSFIHFVQPSECSVHGFLNGGVIMKMMDEVAGTVAYRHCKTNVVTASIDAIDFHESVTVGHIINIFGLLSFASSRSMEIKVVVDAEDLINGRCYRACSAFFTFVSLDANRRPQAIPSINLLSDEEREWFEEGKKRYEERKQRRLSNS